MGDPYRKCAADAELTRRRTIGEWMRANGIGAGDAVCGGLILLMVLVLVGVVWYEARPATIAQNAVEAAEARARKVVCDQAGPKNAAAWAKFMGIKSPAVLCQWEASNPECGDWLTCAVGTGDGAGVYQVRCHSGDGVERDGAPDACQIVRGR
jgi:hypothetical protein